MSVEILDLAALALTAVFFALLYYLHKKSMWTSACAPFWR